MEEKKAESTDEIKIATGEIEGKEFSCVPIIGQIEGHYTQEGGIKATKYDHIIPLLVALDENPEVHGILILINTLGGDVEAGLAMAEVIASLNTPTVSVVLGGGHSIGVPLAVSAKRSFIVESATMTIHPVRTTGTVLGVPQAFHYLEKMQDRIIRFIVSHSKISEQTLREMLTRTDMLVNDVGTVLNGEEAVACGLIDSIGGIKQSIQALKELMKE